MLWNKAYNFGCRIYAEILRILDFIHNFVSIQFTEIIQKGENV